jgi:nucleoside-diphosphate-sugar epimerase
MPDAAEHSTAVVGAAGFVGRELLSQLEAQGIQVTAVVRGLRELSVDGQFHHAHSPADLAGRTFEIVINLAYPTSGLPFEQPGLNAEIMKTVKGLVRPGGRLIQVSTASVFGMTLDRPIRVGPAPSLRDMPYVESKIAAEHEFERDQATRGFSLDIVRLGNVWGAASGAWAMPLVHRLVTGRAAGVAGVPGYSNATDVVNVASYLVFLLHAVATPSVRYHHLGEFSAVPWKEWLEPIAASLEVEPVWADASVIDGPGTPRRELIAALSGLGPRSLYRELASERAVGSWTRAAIRRLPANARARLRSDLVCASEPEVDRLEQIILTILAGRQRFESYLAPGWTPAITKEQSLERVLSWLERR